MSPVSSVNPVSSVSTHNVGMEVWRMTMTQRISQEMRDRVAGKQHNKEPRKVDPAVKVTISPEARKIAQG